MVKRSIFSPYNTPFLQFNFCAGHDMLSEGKVGWIECTIFSAIRCKVYFYK